MRSSDSSSTDGAAGVEQPGTPAASDRGNQQSQRNQAPGGACVPSSGRWPTLHLKAGPGQVARPPSNPETI
jgi:hypothetical protein